MSHSDYAAQAKALHERPLDSTETPEGQRFAVGQRVRCIVDTYAPWGLKNGDEATIEYSYQQKYGWIGSEDAERQKKMYSVKFPGNTLAWVNERELESLPPKYSDKEKT